MNEFSLSPFLHVRRNSRYSLVTGAQLAGLAVVMACWTASAVAADNDVAAPAGVNGDVTAAGSDTTTLPGNSNDTRQPPVIEEGHPLLSQYGPAATLPDYTLSGAGTARPLGFVGQFAPGRCGGVQEPDQKGTDQNNADRFLRLSVSGSETYSDNINLTEHDRQSDFVTAVAPRLDACSSTGRIRGQASYQITGVMYASDSHFNHIYNDLRASTTASLIQNHLYLDANTNYGKRVIEPSLGYTGSNIIRPDENRVSTWNLNVSPYFVQQLGDFGTGVLRYRYGHTAYGGHDIPDVTVHGVSGMLTGAAAADRLTWQVEASTQSVERSGGDYPSGYRTQHFDSATLQLGYLISPTLTLTALGGIEDDYHTNGDVDRWSSTRWQAGFRWARAGNRLEANYGRRFDSASYSLVASHHGRLVDLSVSYQEEPYTAGLDGLNDIGGGYMLGSVGSMGNLWGSDYYNGVDSLRDSGVYLRKIWRARIGFNTARTRTVLTGYARDNDYLTSDRSDRRSRGLELDSRYDLGPRTRIVPSVRWDHYNDDFSTGAEADIYNAGISLVRSISPTAIVSIGYSRGWRNSDSGSDYRENRVTIMFRKAF